MMELTIHGQVYQFHYGMGFLREINKKVIRKLSGGVERGAGLQWAVASLIDGDVEALVDVLDTANKGQDPRVTRALLDEYIEEECPDIDALFDEVLDFLRKSNATKKVAGVILKAVEDQKQRIMKA